MELASEVRLLLEYIFGKRNATTFIVTETFLGIKSLPDIFSDIVLSEYGKADR